MKYRFMDEHRHEFSLTLMCRVLQVARAGFYVWLQCPVSDRAMEDSRLLELIRHSYAASHGVYGARRVFGDGMFGRSRRVNRGEMGGMEIVLVVMLEPARIQYSRHDHDVTGPSRKRHRFAMAVSCALPSLAV